MMKDSWADGLKSAGVDLAVWPDVPDYDAIEVFIGWRPPAGIFKQVCRTFAVRRHSETVQVTG